MDFSKMDPEEIMKMINDLKNSTDQNTHGSETQSSTAECPVCYNQRFIAYKDEEGRFIVNECKCWKAEHAKQLLMKSGLAEFIDKQTFDTFDEDTQIQHLLKKTAKEYLADILSRAGKKQDRNPWLYIGGNPGSGKTHICTAVCSELLKAEIDVKYMQWVTESKRLKFIDDPEAFEDAVQEYVKPSVLYIDDLLKQKYAVSPKFTEGDIKIAFSILNARYFMNKPTIISSEWDLLEQLMDADEAVFSRVYERSKGYTVIVSRKQENNFRLTGGNADG